jgi:hypothetical protein
MKFFHFALTRNQGLTFTSNAKARSSDLIASVPERHTDNLREGMHSLSLPIPMADFTVSMLWHPRLNADPATSLEARPGAGRVLYSPQ